MDEDPVNQHQFQSPGLEFVPEFNFLGASSLPVGSVLWNPLPEVFWDQAIWVDYASQMNLNASDKSAEYEAWTWGHSLSVVDSNLHLTVDFCAEFVVGEGSARSLGGHGRWSRRANRKMSVNCAGNFIYETSYIYYHGYLFSFDVFLQVTAESATPALFVWTLPCCLAYSSFVRGLPDFGVARKPSMVPLEVPLLSMRLMTILS
jgi:hypothetical protein